MDTDHKKKAKGDSLRQLRRALFYETQFRNAIVSDAVSFYDVNVSKDLIENDFFFRDDKNNFVSVPEYLGLSAPCKFSDFVYRWSKTMIPDLTQKPLRNILNLRDTLLEIYEEGRRELVIDYWAEIAKGRKIFFNQRFLLTKNEAGEIYALSIVKDNTKLRESDDELIKKELEKYAYSDPLTHGYNYIKFKEKLKEQGIPGSIICLDIHSFKAINSICGVTRGDDVIKNIWECILLSIDKDKGDLAAHINADHYIIFIPTTDEEKIIEKLKDISVMLMIISIDLDLPQIKPYFGISKWSPGKKIEMSYNEAITAKHNAKNQQDIDYAFFNEEDINRLVHEKELIDSFENAILKKEFNVWFQPKYTPKTKRIVGAEALVRWIKEDGTIIRPSDFIMLFERNNIIRKLDEHIFRNVCIFQKHWLDSGKRIVPISVNLSRASLYYKGVADQYKRITEVIGIEPKWVPIEITESAAIAEESVKDAIDKFHALGFSLHMDDFGTGYSSLASLNMLHFDTMKLDKSLVDFIGEFDGNRLIEHTISLAQELGIQVTAEGVENERQVQFLKNIGCDNIQGFFYSKPVPAETFEKLLEMEILDSAQESANEPGLIEEHISEFNHGFNKPVLYTLMINLTEDKITDFTENGDWCIETSLDPSCYSDAIKSLANDLVYEGDREKFLKTLDRGRLLDSFGGVEDTTVIEYRRRMKEDFCKMRGIVHTFKVAGSECVWLYIKIFCLDRGL